MLSLYFLHTFLFNFCIGFYLILALQWYSYKLSRVLFHFHKPLLHLAFIILPLLVFTTSFGFSFISLAYFVFVGVLGLYFWQKGLDKKLVFTLKVKVFFAFLFVFSIIFSVISLKFSFLFNFLALPLSLISLKFYDLLASFYYLQKAKNKLKKMSNLKIILITASFGKTSIKNFLYELLKDDFITYKTPRSVNTLMGIAADVNTNLSENSQIYIAEAGARVRGDILKITTFLRPEICIIGEIGNAHLEYFKSVENTRKTKLEALSSNNLKKAFLHTSTLCEKDEKKFIYNENLQNIKASLDGLEFDLKIDENYEHFKTPLLGAFNAENLAACIFVSLDLGVSLEKTKQTLSKLKNVEHRLEIISKEPKFIIDDGFNGNLSGMSASYALCKTYDKRRVLVTPGIVEAGIEDNVKLCKVINESFDLVIISAKINAEVFKKNLKTQSIFLKDKSDLMAVLAKHTKAGDLILFSNDAPNFM